MYLNFLFFFIFSINIQIGGGGMTAKIMLYVLSEWVNFTGSDAFNLNAVWILLYRSFNRSNHYIKDWVGFGG